MPLKPFGWFYTMTQLRLRWRRSSSSSTSDPPPPQPQRTINTQNRPSTTRDRRATDANSHPASDSTAPNPQSSALATARALAHAHLATTTSDVDYAPPSTIDSVVPQIVYVAMTSQNEVSEESAPAPAVAQVAPTSPATPALPDSQTDSQPRSQTPPQPEAEPPPISQMLISTVNREPGSPTLKAGSSEDAPSRVDSQAHTTSSASEDIQAPVLDDVRMDSQSQNEKPVDHMTPVKPQLPTPSSSAASSDRAPSPLNFENIYIRVGKSAKESHHKRARIFPKTRELMCYFTGKVSVIASRGFERGRLPTRQTKPPLLKRRHSIDVNTSNGWNTPRATYFKVSEIEVRLMRKTHPFSQVPEKVGYKPPSTERWAHRGNYVAPLQRSFGRLFHARAFTLLFPISSATREPLSQRYTNEPQYECQKLENSFELVDTSVAPQMIPHPARYAAFGRWWHLIAPWDTGIYLELGDATIRNDAFNYITLTQWTQCGYEAWMRDESIDMALEVLRRDLDCDTHGIAIANSTMAQICYFAAFSEDSTSREYDEYKARFRDKKWIFLVVNDAIGGNENDGRSGTHWSLVVLDRAYKHAYYYDSLYPNNRYNTDMGRDISLGMLKILGEDVRDWHYDIQYDCPNQNWHNQFKFDDGACGPFVFKMTELLVNKIKNHRQAGKEHECYIDIDLNFRAYFKSVFHSLGVREDIKMRIARWKAIIDAPQIADSHDQFAIQDVLDIALNDGPVVSFVVPSRPVVPLRKEPRRPTRYANHHRGGSNKNDAIEVKDSDLSSNASSSGHTEVHNIELDDDPEKDPFEDEEMDIVMDDDEAVEDDFNYHGGVSISVNDDASGGHQTVPNSPEHTDEEAEAVTRIF
jgi:hypothetical protein